MLFFLWILFSGCGILGIIRLIIKQLAFIRCLLVSGTVLLNAHHRPKIGTIIIPILQVKLRVSNLSDLSQSHTTTE